jgi:RNA polymerase sigma-70 factor (ECF subfamily)
MKEKNDNKTARFLKLYGQCNRQISSYIFSLIQNFEDANDILQQTTTIMWQKFDQFEIGTDFVSWGIKIAHYQILYYRRKKSNQKVFFSDNLFNQIELVASKNYKRSDDRLKYLRECLKKVTPNDLLLLRERFELNQPVKTLASHTGKSIQYIYRRLALIQNRLYRCIKRNISLESI